PNDCFCKNLFAPFAVSAFICVICVHLRPALQSLRDPRGTPVLPSGAAAFAWSCLTIALPWTLPALVVGDVARPREEQRLADRRIGSMPSAHVVPQNPIERVR